MRGAKVYRVVDVPRVDQSVLDSFSDLPHDPFTPGGQRSRRFSQYRLHFERGADWQMELLPHRPFIQPIAVNSLVGGVQRPFEPLKAEFNAQVIAGVDPLGLDPSLDWQINVHQCRVVCSPDIVGVSVPEGPHRDGHDFGMLAVFGRENITGGINQLFETGHNSDPFFEVTLQPGQALVYDDRGMWHTATDIVARDGGSGHRDLCIIAINEWSHRRYGDEFEHAAMSGDGQAAVVSA